MIVSKNQPPAAKVAKSAKVDRVILQTFAAFATFARDIPKSVFLDASLNAAEGVR